MKLKDLLISKVCLGGLFALAPIAHMHAASAIWTGTTNANLSGTTTNWDTGVPPSTSNDIAIFNNTGEAQASPVVNASQIIGTIEFQQSPTPNNYNIGFNAGSFELKLNNSAGGASNTTSPLATQTFTINNGGTLTFDSTASADISGSGKIHYLPQGGTLKFGSSSTGSTASNAPIDATVAGIVEFNDGTHGGNSVITADGTSKVAFHGSVTASQSEDANITSTGNLTDGIIFDGNSIAGGGTGPTQINLNGSKLQFTGLSHANNAIITAINASEVVFNTNGATTGGTSVSLSDTSKLTVTESNQVTKLNSGSTTSLVQFVANNQTLTTNEQTTNLDSYAGNITGNLTNQFIKDGIANSSLELTGTIAGSDAGNDWEAVSNNGRLIGNTSNLNREIFINSPNGIVQFKQDVTGPNFTDVINGNGTLEKTGAATLIIDAVSSSSTFTGNTQIIAGTMQLDGLLGGTIDVNAGTALTGAGTASLTVDVKPGGTISPGDTATSITTFTAGIYQHEDGAIYQEKLNGSTTLPNTDLIHVTTIGTSGTGVATLSGGTVNVTSTDGTFLIDRPYTILTAESGLSGVFTNATGPTLNQYLVPNLSYDSNNAFLTLGTNFEAFADTKNEQQVAEQLDSISLPSDDLQSVLQALTTLTDPDAFNDALDQLSGQQYSSIFQVSQLSTRRFLRELMVPFRLNSSRDCDCECPRTCCGDIEIWEDIQYGRTYLKGDDNADGYRLRNIDFAIGAQTSFDSCWKVGVAAFYENDHIDYHLGGKARVNTIIGALYGVYQDECYYVLGDLLFGYSHFNVKRDIEFATIDRKAHAHPKVYDVTFYTEAGANVIEDSCYTLQPFVGLEFGWYRHNHFHEEGADSVNLEVKSKDRFNFDSRLGVRASTTLPCDIILSADVAWQHRYSSNDNTVRLRFENFGDDFSIRGPKQKRNGVDGTIFISKNICGDFNVFAEAMGERWEHFSNYTFAIGIDFKL